MTNEQAMDVADRIVRDALAQQKHAEDRLEAAQKSHSQFLDSVWERFAQFAETDAKYARMGLTDIINEVYFDIRLLRAMQGQWDEYTKAQLGVTFTDLYLSSEQALTGNVISLDELKERLKAR